MDHQQPSSCSYGEPLQTRSCLPLCAAVLQRSATYEAVELVGSTGRLCKFLPWTCGRLMHPACMAQRKALEAIARSRNNGVLRAELAHRLGIEPKNFHYVVRVRARSTAHTIHVMVHPAL